MTLREEIIQGLMRGGMSREEASAKVRELVRQSESTGWRRGHDEGWDDGVDSQDWGK